MKRLLALVLCLGAFSPLADGAAQEGKTGEKKPQEQKEAVKQETAAGYDVYVGQYEVAKDFILTVTHENGKLMGQPTGDVKVEFKPEKEADIFFSSDVNARLKFVKNPEGAIIGVVVTIEGKDYPCKKIK